MLEDVKKRLVSLGVSVSGEPSNSDDLILSFTIEKITNHINNQTNLTKIPEGLKEIAVDMVVGEFLFLKKGMGQLEIETIDFSPVTKRVQDGDTDVEFAVGENSTPEANFGALLAYLRHNEVDFVKYRVMTW
ncbi:phage protein [Bacillus sp. OxB-1]|uniref:hypothetical protein n=1 Tax=Bacillus sp. (strain OxB-1) TaxID=98228 RepID=UPI000581EE02|nr:hypothetical protein [Bacillus sp. OxB-1]BAQ11308.1 phage protein [Bacillus sp. OxB-1]